MKKIKKQSIDLTNLFDNAVLILGSAFIILGLLIAIFSPFADLIRIPLITDFVQAVSFFEPNPIKRICILTISYLIAVLGPIGTGLEMLIDLC